MDKVLSLLPGMYEYVISYLDDLIVFSGSVKDHLLHIQKLFGVLKEAGLKLNLAKCTFFAKECTYLWHIISANGLRMNPAFLTGLKIGADLKLEKKCKNSWALLIIIEAIFKIPTFC